MRKIIMMASVLFVGHSFAQLEQDYNRKNPPSSQQDCVPLPADGPAQTTTYTAPIHSKPSPVVTRYRKALNYKEQPSCTPAENANNIKHFVVINNDGEVVETNYPCEHVEMTFTVEGEKTFIVTESGAKVPVRISCKE